MVLSIRTPRVSGYSEFELLISILKLPYVGIQYLTLLRIFKSRRSIYYVPI